MLLAASGGFGLLATLGDLASRQRGGKTFLALDPGEQPLKPCVVLPGQERVACLSVGGRLLVFGLDELRHEPRGGHGLTLMEVDAAKEPLAGVAVFADALRVEGTGRGGRAKDVLLKGSALAAHAGRRARRGHMVEGVKAQRVVPA